VTLIFRFDRPHASSYSSSVVNMSLSSTVTEIFSVEYWRDLEISVRGSLKVIENCADR